jgi:hypothetical protein
MTISRMLRLVAVFAGAAGCGGGGYGDREAAAPPSRATVTFAYEAPTAIDPGVAARFPACVQGVAHTHMHPGWRGFEHVALSADGAGRWTTTFTDVPVGSRERFRVNDPNVCGENPTGAVTRNVLANGVRLTNVVDTPGSGVEPGLAFTVAADGTVTP